MNLVVFSDVEFVISNVEFNLSLVTYAFISVRWGKHSVNSYIVLIKLL